MRLLPTLLLGLVCLAQAEETGRWRLQYFYDEEKSEFTITDLKFPSSQRGIAVGAITSENSVKPMSAITIDGGLHWSLLPLKETGLALFFLNDSLGWMVTDKGLWRTEEGGRSWRKLKAPSGIIRVHFTDPDHGWAVGARKQVWETKDGGAEWSKLSFTDEIKSNPDHTQFAWIEFANKDQGVIGGWSRPPRHTGQLLPDWVEPDSASKRQAWPQLGIVASTFDGGKTWKPSVASIFGQITAAKLSPEGWAVELIEFSDTFEWPSELMFLNIKADSMKRIYREKERKVTDVAIGGPKGPIYLGAVEHFGRLQQLPIPRKVIIIRSLDAEHWTEMPVDYRAVARRVILAAAGPNHLWAATDTGMILKWTP
jgi:photosystem II stability/assembly factor-like uncharacterized protein